MDAKELRIGNWVNAILPNKPWMVDDLVIYHMVKGNIQSVYDPSPVYEPIPLTPEILEKAGFEESQDGYYYNEEATFRIHDNLMLIDMAFFDSGNDRLYFQNIGDVEYLHQLQNLVYALTGEELTIEL